MLLSDVLQNVPSFFRLPSETRYARYDGLLPAGGEWRGADVTLILSLPVSGLHRRLGGRQAALRVAAEPQLPDRR